MNLALIPLFIAMASVQFGASLAKGLFPAFGPAGTTAWRLTVAALILQIAFRPFRLKLTRPQWWAIIRYGMALGLMNLSFYYAIDRIPLGVAVALEFIGPLAVSLLTSPRLRDMVWAVLAGLGLALLFPWSGASTLDPWGVLLALTAGAFWGLYIIFGKKLGHAIEEGKAVALGMLVAALVAMPLGLIQQGTNLWQPSLLVTAILVGLFSSAIPYSLEMFSLKRLSSSTFSILMSLEPALAALMGWLFLKEELGLRELLAITLVIAASLGSTLTAANPEKITDARP